MKKNSFIEGTIVATLGILFVKFLGIIYVIPFNQIIGEQGGALYGYGYNIYQLFLSISSAGFPFAISKITSEYSALGHYSAIRTTYKEALKIISLISIVIFIFLFVFAPQIGMLIIGDSGAESAYMDIAYVIRAVSFAILIVPFLSVTRGLLQGFKYITPYSVSQIIEQIVRIIVILLGSFLCVKVLNLSLKYAVGISMLGAFFGGLVAFIYLRLKIKKSDLLENRTLQEEKKINKKEIIKKIFIYSIPFIMISLVNNLYTTVDMILLSRTMSDILHFPFDVIESIVGVYTTWGVKLNNIILAVSTGIITSLIPNIVSSYTKKDMKDVNDKFNRALQCVLLVIVPMTLFLSLLAKPVWTLFYGNSYYGPLMYKIYVFTALFGGVYTIMINTLQGLSKYKLVIISVLVGLFTNALLDIPFMVLFDKIGLNVSYGAMVAALVGYSFSLMLSINTLKNKYNFKFNQTIERIPKYIFSWIIFIIIIVIMKLFIPVDLTSRLLQIPILMLFGIVSFGIYFYVNYYNGNLKAVFGNKTDSIINKLMFKKSYNKRKKD